MYKVITLFLGLFIYANGQAQQTILVPADYSTIQGAIDAANSGTTILVAPGTYFESLVWPEDIDGIKLISEMGQEQTIIDGGGTKRVLLMEGNYPLNDIQTLTSQTEINGFTIQNGEVRNENGAGMRISDASPKLHNLIVKGNVATGESCSGAGAMLDGFGGEIQNCTFIDNTITTTSRSYGQD